ncbi:MAG TPA: pilus assembly protein [Deltaproteobacteria bacterium]|nr:pilus assembly protein [Deltaproteobacteria bacterium]
MNAPGCLLDTGPLVALFDRNDHHHSKAKKLLSAASPPYQTCEAVLSEACFLLSRAAPNVADQILALGEEGFYEIAYRLDGDYSAVQRLMKKYRTRPISLADACLIRCAELKDEPRIFTFDSDFEIYRWGRNKKFSILQ